MHSVMTFYCRHGAGQISKTVHNLSSIFDDWYITAASKTHSPGIFANYDLPCPANFDSRLDRTAEKAPIISSLAILPEIALYIVLQYNLNYYMLINVPVKSIISSSWICNKKQ